MKQTPLEILLTDKERIRQQCRQQEQKINEGIAYLNTNAGSLLISSVSSLLFSGSGTRKKHSYNYPHSEGTGGSSFKKNFVSPSTERSQTTALLSLADYLSIGKMMIPVLWEIAQPLLITWGIRKIKKTISNAFTGKSEASRDNITKNSC